MADYSERLKKVGSSDTDADNDAVTSLRKSLEKKLAAVVASIPGELQPVFHIRVK